MCTNSSISKRSNKHTIIYKQCKEKHSRTWADAFTESSRSISLTLILVSYFYFCCKMIKLKYF